MVNSPSIFIGYSFGRGNPRPWEYFKIPNLMVNGYDILKKESSVETIHNILSYNGHVFCDSGGWQIIQGAKDIDIYEIINLQSRLKADYNAVLDNGLSERKHLSNLRKYVKYADFDFIPVIPYDTSEKTLKKISQIIENPTMVGIGKLVPILKPPTDYAKLKTAIHSINKIKNYFSKSKIHIFGAGGLNTVLILFMLIDSVDTTSWIHDARFGKIRLLGDGVYSTHPGDNRRSIDDSYTCKCPICKKFSLVDFDARGVHGTQLRAIHNAWVLIKELKRICEEKEEGTYIKYVGERIMKSNSHQSIFKFVLNCIEGYT